MTGKLLQVISEDIGSGFALATKRNMLHVRVMKAPVACVDRQSSSIRGTGAT